MSRSAVISECGRYRYRLDREWDSARPPMFFGMLNPSTADRETNDATIERCERRAVQLASGRWSFGTFLPFAPQIQRH
ncbi:MAG: DUF1643 domain-containing protein [Bauldia sp.]